MNSIDSRIDNISRRVCECFGISDVSKIYTPDKTNSTERLSDARSFAIYILHRDEKITINRLAARFGRTPRAIYWHVRKIEDLMKWHEKERQIYKTLCE